MSDKRIIELPASEEIFNDDWIGKDSPLHETTKIQASVFMALIVAEAKDGMVPYAMLATEWTALTLYHKDQVVIYNGELYRAKDTNVLPTFNPSAWTKISFDTLYRTTLADVKNSICEEWSTSGEYTLKDCAIYEDKLYKCIADTATVGTWVSNEWELVSIYEIIQNLPKSASDVIYDNTESGLESENVQDALDEVTETITELSNATEVTGTASGAIATFTDGADAPLKELKVAVTPYQDLHGYDAPWAGGAGKNKLQTTAQSKTQEGVTYTVNDDGTITVSGTATGYSSLGIGRARVSSSMGNVTISGIANVTNIMWSECSVWDENEQLVVQITGGSQNPSITFDLSSYTNAYYLTIAVKRKSNVATSGTIKPQVEVGSTATSYAPYSNICPIIGWDEAVVTRCGKNLFGSEFFADYIVANVPQATKNTTNKTISYSARQISEKKLFSGFKPNTQYTFLTNAVSGIANLAFYYTDGTISTIETSSRVVSDPNKTVEYIGGCWITGNTVLNYEQTGVFEGVITAEDFEPYAGTTYTIDLDGTRYGGVVDATNGTMTVDRVGIKGVSVARVGTSGSGVKYADTTYIYTDLVQNATTKSDRYVQINTSATGMSGQFRVYNGEFTIYDNRFTDLATAQSLLNDVEFMYELATPITVQLAQTPVKSIEGENNIFADCGDINNVEYVRNLNITINDLLSRING